MHYFIHHLNDFSGSPKILNDKVEEYKNCGEQVFLITNGGRGFLESGEGEKIAFYYRKSRYKVFTLVLLLLFHIRVAFFLVRNLQSNDVVHCNTLVNSPLILLKPFADARFVIHIMEVSLKPVLLNRLLIAFAKRFDRIIALSNFVVSRLSLYDFPTIVTYPFVGEKISDSSTQYLQSRRDMGPGNPPVIGFVASLVWYKGVDTFIRLASRYPEFKFVMVLNGRQAELERQYAVLPTNLEARFNEADISLVYPMFDVFVSLTDRNGWIETFGLTLAEALCFGIPVVSPNIGAQTEYIVDGYNGRLLADESDIDEVSESIEFLLNDERYCMLSENCIASAMAFSKRKYIDSVRSEIEFIMR